MADTTGIVQPPGTNAWSILDTGKSLAVASNTTAAAAAAAAAVGVELGGSSSSLGSVSAGSGRDVDGCRDGGVVGGTAVIRGTVAMGACTSCRKGRSVEDLKSSSKHPRHPRGGGERGGGVFDKPCDRQDPRNNPGTATPPTTLSTGSANINTGKYTSVTDGRLGKHSLQTDDNYDGNQSSAGSCRRRNVRKKSTEFDANFHPELQAADHNFRTKDINNKINMDDKEKQQQVHRQHSGLGKVGRTFRVVRSIWRGGKNRIPSGQTLSDLLSYPRGRCDSKGSSVYFGGAQGSEGGETGPHASPATPYKGAGTTNPCVTVSNMEEVILKVEGADLGVSSIGGATSPGHRRIILAESRYRYTMETTEERVTATPPSTPSSTNTLRKIPHFTNTTPGKEKSMEIHSEKVLASTDLIAEEKNCEYSEVKDNSMDMANEMTAEFSTKVSLEGLESNKNIYDEDGRRETGMKLSMISPDTSLNTIRKDTETVHSQYNDNNKQNGETKQDLSSIENSRKKTEQSQLKVKINASELNNESDTITTTTENYNFSGAEDCKKYTGQSQLKDKSDTSDINNESNSMKTTENLNFLGTENATKIIEPCLLKGKIDTPEMNNEIDAIKTIENYNLLSTKEQQVNKDVDENFTAETEIYAEINDEMNAEFGAEDNAEINTEINAELNAESDAEINAETNNEINAEINAEIHAEINAEIDTEINAEINAETNAEIDAKIIEGSCNETPKDQYCSLLADDLMHDVNTESGIDAELPWGRELFRTSGKVGEKNKTHFQDQYPENVSVDSTPASDESIDLNLTPGRGRGDKELINQGEEKGDSTSSMDDPNNEIIVTQKLKINEKNVEESENDPPTQLPPSGKNDIYTSHQVSDKISTKLSENDTDSFDINTSIDRQYRTMSVSAGDVQHTDYVTSAKPIVDGDNETRSVTRVLEGVQDTLPAGHGTVEVPSSPGIGDKSSAIDLPLSIREDYEKLHGAGFNNSGPPLPHLINGHGQTEDDEEEEKEEKENSELIGSDSSDEEEKEEEKEDSALAGNDSDEEEVEKEKKEKEEENEKKEEENEGEEEENEEKENSALVGSDSNGISGTQYPPPYATTEPINTTQCPIPSTDSENMENKEGYHNDQYHSLTVIEGEERVPCGGSPGMGIEGVGGGGAAAGRVGHSQVQVAYPGAVEPCDAQLGTDKTLGKQAGADYGTTNTPLSGDCQGDRTTCDLPEKYDKLPYVPQGGSNTNLSHNNEINEGIDSDPCVKSVNETSKTSQTQENNGTSVSYSSSNPELQLFEEKTNNALVEDSSGPHDDVFVNNLKIMENGKYQKTSGVLISSLPQTNPPGGQNVNETEAEGSEDGDLGGSFAADAVTMAAGSSQGSVNKQGDGPEGQGHQPTPSTSPGSSVAMATGDDQLLLTTITMETSDSDLILRRTAVNDKGDEISDLHDLDPPEVEGSQLDKHLDCTSGQVMLPKADRITDEDSIDIPGQDSLQMDDVPNSIVNLSQVTKTREIENNSEHDQSLSYKNSERSLNENKTAKFDKNSPSSLLLLATVAMETVAMETGRLALSDEVIKSEKSPVADFTHQIDKLLERFSQDSGFHGGANSDSQENPETNTRHSVSKLPVKINGSRTPSLTAEQTRPKAIAHRSKVRQASSLSKIPLRQPLDEMTPEKSPAKLPQTFTLAKAHLDNNSPSEEIPLTNSAQVQTNNDASKTRTNIIQHVVGAGEIERSNEGQISDDNDVRNGFCENDLDVLKNKNLDENSCVQKTKMSGRTPSRLPRLLPGQTLKRKASNLSSETITPEMNKTSRIPVKTPSSVEKIRAKLPGYQISGSRLWIGRRMFILKKNSRRILPGKGLPERNIIRHCCMAKHKPAYVGNLSHEHLDECLNHHHHLTGEDTPIAKKKFTRRASTPMTSSQTLWKTSSENDIALNKRRFSLQTPLGSGAKTSFRKSASSSRSDLEKLSEKSPLVLHQKAKKTGPITFESAWKAMMDKKKGFVDTKVAMETASFNIEPENSEKSKEKGIDGHSSEQGSGGSKRLSVSRLPSLKKESLRKTVTQENQNMLTQENQTTLTNEKQEPPLTQEHQTLLTQESPLPMTQENSQLNNQSKLPKLRSPRFSSVSTESSADSKSDKTFQSKIPRNVPSLNISAEKSGIPTARSKSSAGKDRKTETVREGNKVCIGKQMTADLSDTEVSKTSLSKIPTPRTTPRKSGSLDGKKMLSRDSLSPRQLNTPKSSTNLPSESQKEADDVGSYKKGVRRKLRLSQIPTAQEETKQELSNASLLETDLFRTVSCEFETSDKEISQVRSSKTPRVNTVYSGEMQTIFRTKETTENHGLEEVHSGKDDEIGAQEAVKTNASLVELNQVHSSETPSLLEKCAPESSQVRPSKTPKVDTVYSGEMQTIFRTKEITKNHGLEEVHSGIENEIGTFEAVEKNASLVELNQVHTSDTPHVLEKCDPETSAPPIGELGELGMTENNTSVRTAPPFGEESKVETMKNDVTPGAEVSHEYPDTFEVAPSIDDSVNEITRAVETELPTSEVQLPSSQKTADGVSADPSDIPILSDHQKRRGVFEKSKSVGDVEDDIVPSLEYKSGHRSLNELEEAAYIEVPSSLEYSMKSYEDLTQILSSMATGNGGMFLPDSFNHNKSSPRNHNFLITDDEALLICCEPDATAAFQDGRPDLHGYQNGHHDYDSEDFSLDESCDREYDGSHDNRTPENTQEQYDEAFWQNFDEVPDFEMDNLLGYENIVREENGSMLYDNNVSPSNGDIPSPVSDEPMQMGTDSCSSDDLLDKIESDHEKYSTTDEVNEPNGSETDYLHTEADSNGNVETYIGGATGNHSNGALNEHPDGLRIEEFFIEDGDDFGQELSEEESTTSDNNWQNELDELYSIRSREKTLPVRQSRIPSLSTPIANDLDLRLGRAKYSKPRDIRNTQSYNLNSQSEMRSSHANKFSANESTALARQSSVGSNLLMYTVKNKRKIPTRRTTLKRQSNLSLDVDGIPLMEKRIYRKLKRQHSVDYTSLTGNSSRIPSFAKNVCDLDDSDSDPDDDSRGVSPRIHIGSNGWFYAKQNINSASKLPKFKSKTDRISDPKSFSTPLRKLGSTTLRFSPRELDRNNSSNFEILSQDGSTSSRIPTFGGKREFSQGKSPADPVDLKRFEYETSLGTPLRKILNRTSLLLGGTVMELSEEFKKPTTSLYQSYTKPKYFAKSNFVTSPLYSRSTTRLDCTSEIDLRAEVPMASEKMAPSFTSYPSYVPTLRNDSPMASIYSRTSIKGGFTSESLAQGLNICNNGMPYYKYVPGQGVQLVSSTGHQRPAWSIRADDTSYEYEYNYEHFVSPSPADVTQVYASSAKRYTSHLLNYSYTTSHYNPYPTNHQYFHPENNTHYIYQDFASPFHVAPGYCVSGNDSDWSMSGSRGAVDKKQLYIPSYLADVFPWRSAWQLFSGLSLRDSFGENYPEKKPRINSDLKVADKLYRRLVSIGSAAENVSRKSMRNLLKLRRGSTPSNIPNLPGVKHRGEINYEKLSQTLRERVAKMTALSKVLKQTTPIIKEERVQGDGSSVGGAPFRSPSRTPLRNPTTREPQQKLADTQSKNLYVAPRDASQLTKSGIKENWNEMTFYATSDTDMRYNSRSRSYRSSLGAIDESLVSSPPGSRRRRWGGSVSSLNESCDEGSWTSGSRSGSIASSGGSYSSLLGSRSSSGDVSILGLGHLHHHHHSPQYKSGSDYNKKAIRALEKLAASVFKRDQHSHNPDLTASSQSSTLARCTLSHQQQQRTHKGATGASREPWQLSRVEDTTCSSSYSAVTDNKPSTRSHSYTANWDSGHRSWPSTPTTLLRTHTRTRLGVQREPEENWHFSRFAEDTTNQPTSPLDRNNRVSGHTAAPGSLSHHYHRRATSEPPVEYSNSWESVGYGSTPDCTGVPAEGITAETAPEKPERRRHSAEETALKGIEATSLAGGPRRGRARLQWDGFQDGDENSTPCHTRHRTATATTTATANTPHTHYPVRTQADSIQGQTNYESSSEERQLDSSRDLDYEERGGGGAHIAAALIERDSTDTIHIHDNSDLPTTTTSITSMSSYRRTASWRDRVYGSTETPATEATTTNSTTTKYSRRSKRGTYMTLPISKSISS